MRPETRRAFRDYGLTVVFAVLLALFIRNFVLESYRVPTLAMSPTLLPGDILFAKKWEYSLKTNPTLKRGQVIIFSDSSPPVSYVRRIIGLPGDRIELKAGQVTLNGTPLYNSKTGREQIPNSFDYPIQLEKPFLDDFASQIIPDGYVFVVGDFRSMDTKLNRRALKKRLGWGLIPISSLQGEVSMIWVSVEPQKKQKGTLFSFLPRLPKIRWSRVFQKIYEEPNKRSSTQVP